MPDLDIVLILDIDLTFFSSVADLELDPYVFGPPGSGSNSTSYGSGSGSGSFYNKAKEVRKTLIPIVLRLLFYFLSLRNDVSVAKKLRKNIIFCCHLEGH
jgi:hypothetical protein